jgi:predicted acetyltransferase
MKPCAGGGCQAGGVPGTPFSGAVFMSLEIRPIRSGEQDAFNNVVRTVFAADTQMHVEMREEWTLCGFEDGVMTTSYGAWPLTMLLNGAAVPFAGVTMVGTLPYFRRRGHLRRVVDEHFRQLHERGERSIAALFASRTAIYQRYGYAVVSGAQSYTIEPRDISLLHLPEATGEFRPAAESDADLLIELYHRFGQGRNAWLLRYGDYFKIPGAPYATYQPPEEAARQKKVIYYEDGVPLGYLVYSVTRDVRSGAMMGQLLNVAEMAWLAPEAYHAIWTYLSRFDLISQITVGKVPPDDPLPHLLLEPKRLTVGVPSSGMAARIVDVEKALPLRPYGEKGTLTFEIIDDLCDWNRGTWRLEATAAGSEVTRGAAAPELTMPVSTLAMLVFGRITATEAARMGRLEVHEPTALPRWDAVMRTERAPYCQDFF